MLTLWLDYPPSMNGYWRSFRGRQIISAKGREYRQQGLQAIGQREPIKGKLEVTITLYPPDKRRRDIDNPIKPLLDLLTHANVYEDDSQIKRLLIVMEPPGHQHRGKCEVICRSSETA